MKFYLNENLEYQPVKNNYKKKPKIKDIANFIYDGLNRLGYNVFANKEDGYYISEQNEKSLQSAVKFLEENNVQFKTSKFRDKFYLDIKIPESVFEEDMYDYDLDDSYIPTYDIDFEIPANLQRHIDEGNIDLESEVYDWEVYGKYLGQAADNINVSYDTLYINGINEDLYNELSRHGYDWLVDLGNDLDEEFPDEEETIEDNEDGE